MGVFPSHKHSSANAARSKIIARKHTPPKSSSSSGNVMRRILGGISHQSTATSPEKTKRVLFPGKEKSRLSAPSAAASPPRRQARETSTSPNGGFFSHPAFKSYKSTSAAATTLNIRRHLHPSPSGKAKATLVGARGLKKRPAEDRKKTRDGKRRVTPEGKAARSIGSSDDEMRQGKIASSSTGAHPSSDSGMHDDHFARDADADEARKRHFADVVAALPPSSPPVFAHDLDEDEVRLSSSPAINTYSGQGNGPSSTHAQRSLVSAPASSPTVSRKRKASTDHAPPIHPEGTRIQKLKVSARTLEGRDDLPVVRVAYDGTYPLVLGRSRRAAATPLDQQEDVQLVMEIEPVPTVLSRDTASHLVEVGTEATGAKLAPLPRTASHASRAHVLVQVVPTASAADDDDSQRIIFSVLGQNGCKIRRLGGDAGPETRYPAGGVVQFVRGAQEKEAIRIQVDMYSCRAVVEWFVPAPVKQVTTPRQPTPLPLSPVVPTAMAVDDALVELLQTPVVRKKVGSRSTTTTKGGARLVLPDDTPSPARSLHSQMTYESEVELDNLNDDDDEPREPAAALMVGDISRQVKKEWIEAAKTTVVEQQPVGPVRRAASAASDLSAPGAAAVPEVPVDIDLKALVATSLVFSGSSAISAPDLVKAILDVSRFPARTATCD